MAKENNGPEAEVGRISFDPDDAYSSTMSLEESLRTYTQPTDPIHTIFQIKPCVYIIPLLSHIISSKLNYPISKIIACSIHLGAEKFNEKFGKYISTIDQARNEVILHGGNWSEKEFMLNELKTDFHTSKMQKWSFRMVEQSIAPADRLASMAGVTRNHMRQLTILGGMLCSEVVPDASKRKIVEILRWFKGVLKEKADSGMEILQSRARMQEENLGHEYNRTVEWSDIDW